MYFDVDHLDLDRCPHCGRAKPTLALIHQWRPSHKISRIEATGYRVLRATTEGALPVKGNLWKFYECSVCHRVIMVHLDLTSPPFDGHGDRLPDITQIHQWWPEGTQVSDDIPDHPRRLLKEALESGPTPAVMATASALTWMLMEKGCKGKDLHALINVAVDRSLLTKEMMEWSDDIRLEANDVRHPKLATKPLNANDKERLIEFALTIADILFVFPSRVKLKREAVRPKGQIEGTDTND